VGNLDLGETAQEVIENHKLRTRLRDVLAIYDYATKHRDDSLEEGRDDGLEQVR
jgi:hypothetical protein